MRTSICLNQPALVLGNPHVSLKNFLQTHIGDL